MKRRTLLIGGAALLARAVSAGEGEKVVVIDRHSFAPAEIEVTAGAVIEWVNRDGDEHDVTERAKVFRSPILDTGERWRRSFTEPGTVEYYCSLHPHMIGHIRVVA